MKKFCYPGMSSAICSMSLKVDFLLNFLERVCPFREIKKLEKAIK